MFPPLYPTLLRGNVRTAEIKIEAEYSQASGVGCGLLTPCIGDVSATIRAGRSVGAAPEESQHNLAVTSTLELDV